MNLEQMRAIDALKTYKELEELKQSLPTGTEANVCKMIAQRQKIGMKKYGTPVASNPLELEAWLQHALEECLDQAIYLQRAIEQIRKESK